MRSLFLLGLIGLVGCEKQTTEAAQASPPVKIALDTISQERAAELDGRLVTASLLIAKPFYILGGKTVVGGPEHFDGIERGIVLNGERYDVDEGKRITVTGRLYVIDHPPARVGGVFVPAHREIRLVEGR